MDKNYTIFGILCIALALGLGIKSVHDQQAIEQYRQAHPELYAANGTVGNTTPATTGNPAASTPAATSGNSSAAPAIAVATAVAATPAPAVPSTPAALAYLENPEIKVTLTEDEGGIQTIELKKYVATLNGKAPVMFNAGAPRPALSLSIPSLVKPGATSDTYWSWTGRAATSVIGNPGLPPVPLLARYTLDKSATNQTAVTFRGATADGLEVVRTYTLGSGSDDAYLIHQATTITNRGSKPVAIPSLFVNAGMAPAPAPDASSISKYYLDFGYYDGSAANFVTVAEFTDRPAMLLGLYPGRPKEKDYVYSVRDSADLRWVSVKDQFFSAVLTPQGISGKGFYVQGVSIKVDNTDQTTVTGDMVFSLGVLAPGQQKTLEFNYYAGPKEYVQLDRLGERQDLNMQFGFFSTFSKFLLLALIAIHKFLAPFAPAWAWGWAIIVFTMIIKGVTWPLTAIQVRSARRMSKLQAPLKALKEKYKDNQQKYQSEMIELYKKHKINPAAGCLPLLVQGPILWAFYSTLRTASELRYAGFFWIHDLSQPDTVARLTLPGGLLAHGLPINILPILMAISQQVQMSVMPTPSTDDAQRRMMRFLPLIFFSFFYSMPSGLVLYYTCSNFFIILQQWVNRRQKDFDPADQAAPAAATDRPKAKRR